MGCRKEGHKDNVFYTSKCNYKDAADALVL